jgi:hypothetical protein
MQELSTNKQLKSAEQVASAVDIKPGQKKRLRSWMLTEHLCPS